MKEVKRYKIIYADSPWQFNNKNTVGSMVSGASAHYNTMSLKDICEMPVESIADDNCVLFMWWVGSMPKEALQVVEAWGFKLKTMTAFNWIKTTKHGKPYFGMGFWTRQGSENCLVAVKGKPKRINAAIRAVIELPVTRHSEKPNEIRQAIVRLMGDIPRIELFARNAFDGWDVFGNQVENSISLTPSNR